MSRVPERRKDSKSASPANRRLSDHTGGRIDPWYHSECHLVDLSDFRWGTGRRSRRDCPRVSDCALNRVPPEEALGQMGVSLARERFTRSRYPGQTRIRRRSGHRPSRNRISNRRSNVAVLFQIAEGARDVRSMTKEQESR